MDDDDVDQKESILSLGRGCSCTVKSECKRYFY